MEELKYSVRDFNSKQQHTQSLTKGVDYYRVTLHSEHRQGAAVEDALGAGVNRPLKGNATFLVPGLLPNQRADLLNGRWEVHMEQFRGYLSGEMANIIRAGLKVCLPDLRKGSQDYVTTGEGRTELDDAIGHVMPSTIFANSTAAGATTGLQAAGNAAGDVHAPYANWFDRLQIEDVPLSREQVINAQDVGKTVDPAALLEGRLRITLRDALNHRPLAAFAAADFWSVTLLFVHKP